MGKLNVKDPAQVTVQGISEQEIVQETVQEQTSQIRFVVQALPGTEDAVRKAWEKMCDFPFKIITQAEGISIKELLGDLLADNELEERFTLIPANLLPVAPLRLEEIVGSFVYIRVDGRKKFFGEVPMTFSKDILTEFLPENDELEDESFVAKYIKEHKDRANEVGFHFGNFITPAYRATPCENVIIEAFMKKRFVYANADAWPVVWRLYESYLLSK